jgi:hypothetical protein
MHPLHTELTNEHIVLPDNSHIGAGKEARLAWVHSLCAYSLNCSRQTGGCVFACASDGTYDEGEQGGDTSDEEANTVDEDGTSQQKIADVHHFGFAMNNQNNDEENLYARTIKNFQTLRCTICGANDQPAGAFLSSARPTIRESLKSFKAVTWHYAECPVWFPCTWYVRWMEVSLFFWFLF